MFLGQNPLIEYLHHLENSSNLLIMSVSQLCLSLDSTRSNPRFAAANLSAKTGAKTLSVLAVQEIEWAEQADFGQIEEIGSTGQRWPVHSFPIRWGNVQFCTFLAVKNYCYLISNFSLQPGSDSLLAGQIMSVRTDNISILQNPKKKGGVNILLHIRQWTSSKRIPKISVIDIVRKIFKITSIIRLRFRDFHM